MPLPRAFDELFHRIFRFSAKLFINFLRGSDKARQGTRAAAGCFFACFNGFVDGIAFDK
jgi:hypothetical protein